MHTDTELALFLLRHFLPFFAGEGLALVGSTGSFSWTYPNSLSLVMRKRRTATSAPPHGPPP